MTRTTLMMANYNVNYDKNEAWWVSSLATRYILCSAPTFLNTRKRKWLHLYFQMFSGFFLLVNGQRNWGQLNKWAVLHFPSNIVQITCHCYSEKERTILPNVTWQDKVQSYSVVKIHNSVFVTIFAHYPVSDLISSNFCCFPHNCEKWGRLIFDILICRCNVVRIFSGVNSNLMRNRAISFGKCWCNLPSCSATG